MKKFTSTSLKLLLLVLPLTFIYHQFFYKAAINGAPPYGEPEANVPAVDERSFYVNFKRPEGPAKVALQVGHWKNEEFPDELEKLKTSTGASGGGKAEWEVNLDVAQEVEKILKQRYPEIIVEVLPATVPEKYWADVFIAIHADGSLDTRVSGYKIANAWRDYSKNAPRLVELLSETYESSTSLPKDPNISRNMRGYYAFAWWRYDHAVHPMTTSAIVETGFLTNYYDRQMLINKTELPANGIAEGVINYLVERGLLQR